MRKGGGGGEFAPEARLASRGETSSIVEDPQGEGGLSGRIAAGSFSSDGGAAPKGGCCQAEGVRGSPEGRVNPAVGAAREARGNPPAVGGCDGDAHSRGGRSPRYESILPFEDQARIKRGLGFFEGRLETSRCVARVGGLQSGRDCGAKSVRRMMHEKGEGGCDAGGAGDGVMFREGGGCRNLGIKNLSQACSTPPSGLQSANLFAKYGTTSK